MKYALQLVFNNLLQQIPAIVIHFEKDTTHKKYFFNTPEQFSRYISRHHIKYIQGSPIFFTRFNTEAIAGLNSLILEQQVGVKLLGTKIYLNSNVFRFWNLMRKYYGFRFICISFYDYQNSNVILGLKEQQQISKLIASDVSKFLKCGFSNQQLLQQFSNTNNAKQHITPLQTSSNQANSGWIYRDETIQFHTFTIGKSNLQSQIYYNQICIPKQKFTPISKQKLQTLEQTHNITLSPSSIAQIRTSGQLTVTNNLTITLQDIKQESSETPIFIILHYKTKQHIQEILNNQILDDFIDVSLSQRQRQRQRNCIKYVVHVVEGNGDVIFMDQFSKLRVKFGANVQHVVANPSCRVFGSGEDLKGVMSVIYPYFRALYEVQTYGFMPNLLTNAQRLYQNYIVSRRKSEIMSLQLKNDKRMGRVILSRYLHQLKILPTSTQGYNPLHLNHIQKKLYQPPKFPIPIKQIQIYNSDYITKIKDKLNKLTTTIDPQIIFLGTSSSRSTLSRNVTGILIRLFNKENNDVMSLLLDCGEGVYDQLVNHYGDRYWQELVKVRVLFVSHLHLDHCSGVFQFLSRRNQAIKRHVPQEERKNYSIFVILPENMIRWFEEYNRSVEKIDEFTELVIIQSLSKQSNREVEKQKNEKNKLFSKLRFKNASHHQIIGENFMMRCFLAQNEDLQFEQEQKVQKQLTKQSKENIIRLQKFKKFMKQNKIVSFTPVSVVHCQQSYGLVFEHEQKIKIAYSGDCRPSSDFTQLAKDSTIMIHEATFKDHLKSKAEVNKHSTTSQAIEIGYKSNSMYTILTHFSVYQESRIAYIKQLEKLKQLLPEVNSQYLQNNVIHAYDHLQFYTSQMYKIPTFCNILDKRKL